jgi:TolB-like protein
MASIIQGYEYDIFISYRQKDNKGEGWVNKFVDALRTELEATFKEDISVYFDENPHDRLQETHNVDKSLEGKLKCLIFIPILSRTYCDQGSYAWQYEFLAFLRMAETDQFGRDVRLRSGNVASRILPVRIHDLENEDVKLFEKETKSELRALDFVFKTASGVNRPLKAYEDHPMDNLNKIFYSDQINRVANSIDEIIHSLKTKQTNLPGSKLLEYNPISDTKGEDVRKLDTEKTLISKKSKIGLLLTLAVFLSALGVFGVFRIIEKSKQAADIAKLEKSIAVLPFLNDSPEEENAYFINGIMEEVLNNLQKIKEFRVLSRTSTDQFKGQDKPTIPEIAKKLGVNYIVEGSGQKYGNTCRLRVQLIAAKNERHLWAESYEKIIIETKDIYITQSEIAQSIASALKATITPEEKQLIDITPTASLRALDFFQRGRDEHTKYWVDNTNTKALANAISYYKMALKTDSAFAQAYTGLAIARLNSYWTNASARMEFSENELNIVRDSIITLVDEAIKYNKKLEEAYLVRGWSSTDDELGIREYNKALEINPNYGLAYNNIAEVFHWKGENINYIKYKLRSIELERGPLLPSLLKSLAEWYEGYGFSENAIDIYNQIFRLTNDTLQYFQNMSGPYYASENWEESIRWANKILEINPDYIWAHGQLAAIYSFIGNDDLFNYHAQKITELNPFARDIAYYKAFFLWRHGEKVKANAMFDQAIEFLTKLIEAGLTRGDYPYLFLSQIYSLKGNQENAIQYLSKIGDSFPTEKWVIVNMEYDPLLENIRSDERFQKILIKTKSDWQKEHEKIRIWLEQNNMLKI